jgi:hypothetical protein
MSDPVETLAGLLGLKPQPAAIRPLQPVLVGHPCKLDFYGEDHWGVLRPWYQWTWYVSQPGEIARGAWEKIQDFQTPVDEMKFALSDAEKESIVRDGMSAAMKTPFGQEIARKIDLSGQHSTVWQFSVVVEDSPNTFDWMRLTAPLGQARIVEWTWFDLRVKRPALRVVAALLNVLTRFGHSIINTFSS